MKWKELEYSRTQIIGAGKIIKDDCATEDQIAQAMEAIDNWRAAHAFPLHVIYIHFWRMARNLNDIVVAQRLKRLDSIIGKLQ